MAKSNTQADILSIARDILKTDGGGALSFDAIASRLGRSKQAVLYWYPTKQALLAALFVPWLQAEAKAAEAALNQADPGAPAIEAFVRAVAAFHIGDLERFRLIYLLPQTSTPRWRSDARADDLSAIHDATGPLYDALSAKLTGPHETRRARAVALHMAVLGLVMVIALGEALSDPVKQSPDALLDALVAQMTGAD